MDIDATTPIELTPLDPDDARRLVLAASADDPLLPETVDAIVERGAGNPLFLEELVRVAQSGDAVALPESLEAVIASQIDALAPNERRLLRYAAVLGQSFSAALLAEVTGEEALANADAVADRLAPLVQVTPDGRVQFRHRLIRDVAYAALPFRQRRDLHARAAQVIERTSHDELEERAAVLAMHCAEAHQFEKAWTYGRLGAGAARAKFALVEAMELYERAIAASRRVEQPVPEDELASTWFALGECRQLAARYDSAKAAYEQAGRLWRDERLRIAAVCGRQAQIADRTGNPASAVRWLKRGLRALDGDGSSAASAERAHLTTALAWARQQTGKLRDAIRLCFEAMEEAERGANRTALAEAYTIADQVFLALGERDRAVHAQAALAIYEELESHQSLATHLLNLGGIAYWEGRWSEALELYERSRASFLKIGDVVDAALSSCNAAEIFTDQGRLDDAEEALEDALSTWRGLRFAYGVALATRHLGRVTLRRGDPHLARERFLEARAVFEQYGLAPKLLEIDVWLAECALAAGEIEEADALLAGALAAAVSSQSNEHRPMIHRLRAFSAMASGRLDDAWSELDESLAIARARAARYDVALALHAFSVLVELGGREAAGEASEDSDYAVLLEELGVLSAPRIPLPA